MDIPIEVIVYLFKYLSHSDRVSASQTCRLWYEAACDNTFQNRECVYFIKNMLQEDCYPCNVFKGNTIRKIVNLSLREIEIATKIVQFWQQNCRTIKFLEFDQCDIQEKIFVNILNHCVNLESLTVANCRELFMSARFIEDDIDNLHCLKKVKILNLSQNRYLTDALFNKFVSNTRVLEQLNLSDCPVSFHSGLYKKFYPFSLNKDGHKTPSESVLTFHYILEFLKTNGSKIKKLSFNNTLIDGVALKTISELPHLKLVSLEMFSCDQLNNDGLLALTQCQSNLIELDIGRCSRVTDQSIISISQNLCNLKSLCIKRCRAVTNIGVAELWNLKKLKYLDISECELINGEGIASGLCRDTNTVLTEINISALNLDESIVILISETIPNLTVLNMNFCFTSVTDNSIQSVFKNLIKLRSLKISHCDQVSDAGLTGMGMGKHITSSLQEVPIRRSVLPPENFHRISLRSRAEEEIVRDAQRKKDVREMCENVVGETIQGYSMALLKNLEYLNVSNCNRITDVSLMYAFNCVELKSLNLSECKQITSEGLKHLTANCPSIQTIELVNCYSTTDQAVSVVVKSLRRLKHLHLRGCNLLTDACIDVIQSECKILKFLDLQGCRNISPDLANSLLSLPTLHTLHLSKPGPYITEGLKNRLPTPPPIPSLTNLRRRIF